MPAPTAGLSILVWRRWHMPRVVDAPLMGGVDISGKWEGSRLGVGDRGGGGGGGGRWEVGGGWGLLLLCLFSSLLTLTFPVILYLMPFSNLPKVGESFPYKCRQKLNQNLSRKKEKLQLSCRPLVFSNISTTILGGSRCCW